MLQKLGNKKLAYFLTPINVGMYDAG